MRASWSQNFVPNAQNSIGCSCWMHETTFHPKERDFSVMKMYVKALASVAVFLVALVGSMFSFDCRVSPANSTTTSSSDNASNRRLAGLDIPHTVTQDDCKVGEDDNGENIYGECNATLHFPECQEDTEFICYNRVNRRDKFHEDKQPYYYIDPRRVMCLDEMTLNEEDGGCNVCTPGRYCLSENRCILDEESFPCAAWK